jgi:hypothetical protein
MLVAGCPFPLFTSGVAGGTVVGAVEYNGLPAPGKTVHLLKRDANGTYAAYRPSGTLVTATTNDAGVYTFSDLTDGTYMAQYLSVPVLDAQGSRIGPNEVADWRTPGVNVSTGQGGRLAPFEISFNGLIYPESGRDYHVSDKTPLPFHWSTHLKAARYRVVIYQPSIGGQPSNKEFWGSEYTTSPSALFQKKVSPGNYSWELEIRSDAGIGHSLRRNLDLSTPLPPQEDPDEIDFPE